MRCAQALKHGEYASVPMTGIRAGLAAKLIRTALLALRVGIVLVLILSATATLGFTTTAAETLFKFAALVAVFGPPVALSTWISRYLIRTALVPTHVSCSFEQVPPPIFLRHPETVRRQ